MIGTTYYYKIVAYNQKQDATSSRVVSVTIALQAPDMSINSADENTINLTWNVVDNFISNFWLLDFGVGTNFVIAYFDQQGNISEFDLISKKKRKSKKNRKTLRPKNKRNRKKLRNKQQK